MKLNESAINHIWRELSTPFPAIGVPDAFIEYWEMGGYDCNIDIVEANGFWETRATFLMLILAAEGEL